MEAMTREERAKLPGTVHDEVKEYMVMCEEASTGKLERGKIQ